MSFKFRKNDPTRLRSLDYFIGLTQIKLGIVVVPMTAQDKRELDDEYLLCADYWKGVPSAINDLIAMGAKAGSAVAFANALCRMFGTAHTPVYVIGVVKTMVTNPWVGEWVTRFGATYGGVTGKAMEFVQKLGEKKAMLLIALVSTPYILMHLGKGNVHKAMGELMKTVAELACAPAAFIDLIDSVAGTILPQWFLDNKLVRMVRCLNPLAGVQSVSENLVFLGMAFGYARQRNWVEFERGLGKWADAMDNQPQAIFTELTASFVVVLDNILPDCVSKFNGFGLTYASLRSLADYTRQVRAAGLQ